MSAKHVCAYRLAPEISLRDGLLLALRSWAWLVLVPLIVMVAATALYWSLPVPNRSIAVLNTDLASVGRAIDQADVANIAGLSVRYEQSTAGTVILTGEALDGDVALRAVQALIAEIPPNEFIATVLTPGQLLELRAQRQYLGVLENRVATGRYTADLEPALLQQEIVLVKSRLRELETLDVPGGVVPVIATDATIVPTRTPPTRNVILFSFLATLFATWTVIYGLEQRRLNRLAAAP